MKKNSIILTGILGILFIILIGTSFINTPVNNTIENNTLTNQTPTQTYESTKTAETENETAINECCPTEIPPQPEYREEIIYVDKPVPDFSIKNPTVTEVSTTEDGTTYEIEY